MDEPKLLGNNDSHKPPQDGFPRANPAVAAADRSEQASEERRPVEAPAEELQDLLASFPLDLFGPDDQYL